MNRQSLSRFVRAALLTVLALALAFSMAQAQDKKRDKKQEKKDSIAAAQAQQQAAAQAQAQAEQQAKQAAEEKARVLQFCRQLDVTAAPTVDGATNRVDCYKRMQLAGQGDKDVDGGYLTAMNDLDRFRKDEETRRASDSSAAETNRRLEATKRAIETRNLDDAESTVDEVLAIQPTNARALAYKDRIAALKRARQLKIMLFAVVAAVVILAAGLGVVTRILFKKRSEKQKERAESMDKRKAVLKVVDGIGRGKLYTIDSPIFRIGAANSSKAEEKNDLVISDSDANVSRYHCSILRKDGDYYLIDSSMNGTFLNNAMLKRGEHHRLDDGDEVTIADVSKLKFLYT